MCAMADHAGRVCMRCRSASAGVNFALGERVGRMTRLALTHRNARENLECCNVAWGCDTVSAVGHAPRVHISRDSASRPLPPTLRPGDLMLGKILFRYLKPYGWLLLGVLAFQIVSAVANLLPAPPERRHHRQRRLEGRHRVHLVDRRRSCSRSRSGRSRRRSSPRTSRRARRWPPVATSATTSSSACRTSPSARSRSSGPVRSSPATRTTCSRCRCSP